ncbi:hypothetical protein [Halalkalibacillus halophilus]|uniref:hypothetical protein n=1 Tax=Halalkalibacillus halophilus TaxID=392827 RepID=UPI0004858483|nr:hypothetical protein [Halalkalibacillus halophilus]
MNRKNMAWVVSLLISLFGFYLIQYVFTVSPSTTSGNGNLGILIIILFSPFFLLSYYFTFQVAHQDLNIKNPKIKLGIVTGSVILCTLLFFLIADYRNNLIQELGGPPTNPDSTIHQLGWMNQYTNSIYFNLYTYSLTHIIALSIGVLWNKNKKDI